MLITAGLKQQVTSYPVNKGPMTITMCIFLFWKLKHLQHLTVLVRDEQTIQFYEDNHLF